MLAVENRNVAVEYRWAEGQLERTARHLDQILP
jgi:hypothetical protein